MLFMIGYIEAIVQYGTIYEQYSCVTDYVKRVNVVGSGGSVFRVFCSYESDYNSL